MITEIDVAFAQQSMAVKGAFIGAVPDAGEMPPTTQLLDVQMSHPVVAVTQTWSSLTAPATFGENSNEGVRTDEGLVLWLTGDGLDGILHLGFVRGVGNSTFVAWQSTAPLPAPPLDARSIRGLNAWMSVGPGIGATYSAACDFGALWYHGTEAVPYNSTGSPTIQPGMGPLYSDAKPFAGYLQMAVDGIPAGVFNLTGQFSAGNINDTRGLAAFAADVESWSTPALQLQSTLEKDTVKLEAAQDGITFVLGSDIPKHYSPPIAMLTDTLDGGIAEFTINKYRQTIYDAGVTPAAAGYYNIPCFHFYATPTNTTYWQNTGGAVGYLPPNMDPTQAEYFTRIDTGRIDMRGTLTISVRAGVSVQLFEALVNSTDLSVDLQAEAIHIYATTDRTGHVNYTHVAERKLVWHYTYPDFSGEQMHTDAGQPLTRGVQRGPVEFTPNLYHTSMQTQGVYFGSYVHFYVSLNGAAPNGPTIVPSITMNIPPKVVITARTVNKDGCKGPCRVGIYRNLSLGQSFILRGTLHAMAIPTGQTQQIKRGDAGKQPVALSKAVYTLLSLLYNGPCEFFRRVSTTREYERCIRYIRQLNVGNFFAELGQQDPRLLQWTRRVLTGSSSSPGGAGLLGDIGGAIDGLIGGAYGQYGAGGDGESAGMRRTRFDYAGH